MIMEILLMMVVCVVALHFLIYIFISIYWGGGAFLASLNIEGMCPSILLMIAAVIKYIGYNTVKHSVFIVYSLENILDPRLK